MLNLLN